MCVWLLCVTRWFYALHIWVAYVIIQLFLIYIYVYIYICTSLLHGWYDCYMICDCSMCCIYGWYMSCMMEIRVVSLPHIRWPLHALYVHDCYLTELYYCYRSCMYDCYMIWICTVTYICMSGVSALYMLYTWFWQLSWNILCLMHIYTHMYAF